jgi:hypothetical protein
MSREDAVLYRALLSAFPDQGSLERMLRLGMDLSLDEISAGNLSDRVFAVIRFAEAQGRLDELVRVAREDNPGNPELRAAAAARAARSEPHVTVPASPARVAMPVGKRALRAALEQHYSLEELQLLCADLQEDLGSAGTEVRLTMDDLAGGTKAAKVLSLVEYLDRRGKLGHLVEAIRLQRPGIV